MRGNAGQPRGGDERPVRQDAAEAQFAQVAQLESVRVPVLRFRPGGGFVVHRLANDRLETVRADEDVARRGGPILEA